MSSLVVLTANTAWYLFNFRQGTIERLLADGYRVSCIAPMDEYVDRLKNLGVSFHEIKVDGKNTGLVQEIKSQLAIFRLVRKLKPDFVFNFTIKMNLYVGLSCFLLGIGFANNVSGLGTVFLHDGKLFKLARLFYGLINSRARTVFFQNEEDLSTFIRLGLAKEEKAVLLPGSGINLGHFAYSPLPKHDTFTFIMIARLIADKGVREYVDAARLLHQKNPKVRFLLLGASGVSNHSAISHEEIAAWESEGIIEYLGHQDKVIPWIKKADVLVLPSYREGMPRTVLEAAGLGRPAIVSDVPGCRQSIENNRTGWLVKVKDVEDLLRVMENVVSLKNNGLEEFSRRARANIEKQFSEEIVVNHYMSCLKSSLSD